MASIFKTWSRIGLYHLHAIFMTITADLFCDRANIGTVGPYALLMHHDKN